MGPAEIKRRMDLHDQIAEELLEKKSLAALIFLVEQGRELEFTFHGKPYFITPHNQKEGVSLFCGKAEEEYPTVPLLLESAKLDGVPFLEAWPEVILGILF